MQPAAAPSPSPDHHQKPVLARRARGVGLVRRAPLVALLGAITCGSLDQFDISQTASTTLQGATLLEQLVGDIGFGGFLNMDITQNEELQNQGVEKNQVDSVHVTALTLSITDPPSGQDFSFLDQLAFYAEAEGLARVRIASGGPFAAGARQVSLTIDDVDLAPYATAPAMTISTDVTGRRPNQSTTLEATIDLRVDVNVSGVLCGG